MLLVTVQHLLFQPINQLRLSPFFHVVTLSLSSQMRADVTCTTTTATSCGCGGAMNCAYAGLRAKCAALRRAPLSPVTSLAVPFSVIDCGDDSFSSNDDDDVDDDDDDDDDDDVDEDDDDDDDDDDDERRWFALCSSTATVLLSQISLYFFVSRLVVSTSKFSPVSSSTK